MRQVQRRTIHLFSKLLSLNVSLIINAISNLTLYRVLPRYRVCAQNKVLIKSALPVRLFVCSLYFSEMAPYYFHIFCMNVRFYES